MKKIDDGAYMDELEDGFIFKDKYKDEKHHVLDISHPPMENVLSVDEFRKRVALVFAKISEILSNSYGPYGFASIISNYPFYHMTKDGFSIMKYISLSKKYNVIDDAIKRLIEAPCTRLNFSVGDGTTTAVIATNAIYQSYLNSKEAIDNSGLPPREIISIYKKVANQVKKELDNKVRHISTLSHDYMVEKIGKIANIASNGDEEITNIIKDLYDKLEYPLINITKSVDNVTRTKIIDGYHFDLILMDEIYVNNDDRSADYTNADIILFDHKVLSSTFDSIILPLYTASRSLNRKLIVVAPMYDEVAMIKIKKYILSEYTKTKDNYLILTIGQISGKQNRDMYEDLAMLLNTTIISRTIESDIIDSINNDGSTIFNVVDIMRRGIDNINIIVNVKDKFDSIMIKASEFDENIHEHVYELKDVHIRCGFVGNVNISVKDGATFNNLYYDKDIYNKTLRMVEETLEEANRKSETIGTHSLSVQDIQKRLFNLRMKVGFIEVGGDSLLSQEIRKDAVLDTVKACESAYINGVVHGCSVDTILSIRHVMNTTPVTSMEYTILEMMLNGFLEVYGLIISSKPHRTDINHEDVRRKLMMSSDTDIVKTLHEYFYNIKITDEEASDIVKNINSIGYINFEYINDKLNVRSISTSTILAAISVFGVRKPINIVTNEYDDNIINSSKTDKEVINTTTDLISLLITGNQFIVMDTDNSF